MKYISNMMVSSMTAAAATAAAAAAAGGNLRSGHHQPPRELTGTTSLPDGIWDCRGYGMALHVINSEIRILEETDISCVPNNMLLPFLDYDVQIEKDDNGDEVAIVTARAATITDFHCYRTDTFQAGCALGLTPTYSDTETNVTSTRDALVDFDILVQTFREHHAFFKERNVDWDVLAAAARVNLTSSSSDQELWDVLTALLKPTDDPHVMLFDGAQLFRAKDFDESDMHQMLSKEFEKQRDVNDYGAFVELQMTKWREAVSGYLKGGVGVPGNIRWGEVQKCQDLAPSASTTRSTPTRINCNSADNTRIGYLEVPAFDIALGGQHAFFRSIDAALTGLLETDTLIIDIRMNPGGFGSWGLEMASRFTSVRVAAFTKKAMYDGDQFTPQQMVYIEPNKDDDTPLYDGKVMIITSELTISAAESFTLAMNELPQTTTLGRRTMGAFSDRLQKMLPTTGWQFSASNEIYAAALDGTVYEAVGLPPDVLAPTELLNLEDREAGTDSWLELAIETATATATVSEPKDSSSASAWLLKPTVSLLLVLAWMM